MPTRLPRRPPSLEALLAQVGGWHEAMPVLALLRHAGFRYTVLSHQNTHGVSNQTARSDLQKLAGRGLLTPEKDGKRELFRVPADLAARLPHRSELS